MLQKLESFVRIPDWRLTTAEILYHLPDHPGVLQTFIWQKLDRAPGFPELTRHHRPDGSLRSIWVGVPGGAFLAIEAVTGEPEPVPFRHERPGLLMLAFRIPKAARAASVETFTRAGVPLEHETRWTFYVRDPEGNRVALSHHPED